MIRPRADVPPENKSAIAKATPEMLEKRREFLRRNAGAWADEEGERIERIIEELFERPEPFETLPTDHDR